jgi:ribosomal protein S18 acetylase RimI-like enzyme
MRIFPVKTADIPTLHQALGLLSQDLGDTHLASLAALKEAAATWCALLAMDGDVPTAALLASPLFSTTRGGAGLFVSDLWVAKAARGQGLGQRLLAAALREWTPTFVKLSVYADNAGAAAFYARAGFVRQDDINMILHGAALDRLRGLP